jgi:hypothetical protein
MFYDIYVDVIHSLNDVEIFQHCYMLQICCCSLLLTYKVLKLHESVYVARV